ncbi:MAG: membrane protein insertion efficiency factor YidD [Candidatus Neomarinimicrobiota bacterium]
MRSQGRRDGGIVVRILTLLALLMNAGAAQTVPADSLLSGMDLLHRQKLSIAPIALFQRMSYAAPGMNCQFEPSCSHFMAQAIARHDVVKGLVMGTDRLIRCNPFAFQYHLKEQPDQFSVDGRMMDPVPGGDNRTRLSANTAYSIIPGLGRALAGHGGDGLVSFLTVATLAAVTARAHQGDNVGATVTLGSLTAVFWIADFYAASRTRTSHGDGKRSASR